jgi:CubicO group peptidase (beta-lactamase class C family)
VWRGLRPSCTLRAPTRIRSASINAWSDRIVRVALAPVELEAAVDEAFAGAVSVSRGDEVLFERAYGMAHRAYGVPTTTTTRFAIASGSKAFTALTVASLVADGTLTMATPARELLGADLPLIAADVTVEHLLTHTSGIGDYLDEEIEAGDDDHVLTVPVHELATTEQYLAVLDGIPTAFPAGQRFAYNNGGFVVLALLAERAAGRPFHDLVRDRVLAPAGMGSTAYLRSDALPGAAATGYLTDGRTNVFHLPVVGNGDGGAYTTVADLRAFWAALFAGRIVDPGVVAQLVRPRSAMPDGRRYGAGFWLRRDGPAVYLEGCDPGVSFRSVHDPGSGLTHTVVSTTIDGAWPVSRRLAELLDL